MTDAGADLLEQIVAGGSLSKAALRLNGKRVVLASSDDPGAPRLVISTVDLREVLWEAPWA
jgi:hypothetical protein